MGEYFYRLDGAGVDKIGDAVVMPDGTFLVMERDDATGAAARKLVYRIDIDAATNFLGYELPAGVELQDDAGLAALGVTPAAKSLVVDLGAIGYDRVDKPEGLALIDENTLAVLNDNDFGMGGVFDPATGLIEENPNPRRSCWASSIWHRTGWMPATRMAASTLRRGRCRACSCPMPLRPTRSMAPRIW